MLKNIIVVCDYAYIEGGASKVAIQTALSLSKQTDLNIYFFAGCGEICDELKNSKVVAKSLGMYDLLGNPSRIDAMMKGIYNKKAGKEFEDFIKDLNLDETVVHIHTWTKVLSSAIFEVCNRKKIKTFLTIHDYFLTCPNGGCFNYVKKEICCIQPMSLKCITCNCDARNYPQKVWRCLRQFKQNQVIHNFTDLNYITISKFQKMQLTKRFSAIENSYTVKNIIDIGNTKFITDSQNNDIYLLLGRVTKEKGADLFCEAIAKANVRGVVIGDGPLKESLQAKYQQIEFLGWKNKQEIDEILKQTRALVFSSVWYEGSPLTVPEVQAHGIPCIVTDCSAATDDIVPGVNGEIVPANVDDMVKAITRFKDDEYIRELSNNTYKMFDENRGSEKWYVDNLIEVYKE